MDVPKPATSERFDAALLSAFAALILVVHFYVGNGYGFHRDEFQFLDDARHLQWGFVAYPPLTAFCGRIAIALFGISPQVFRLPAAFVNAVSLVLIGLTARELGGRRPAQIVALFAALPLALAFSSVLQYNTLDLLAWSLIIYFTARLLRTGDERYWIGVGAGIGIGVLSKYSIAFPVVSLLAALVILPSQRHHLSTRWFWYGALTAAIIAAPNLIWLASHHFITLQMEYFIHARDVRHGRADGYYTDQIKFTLFGFPLAMAGLVSLVRNARFRLLSTFYIGPFLLFAIARGRGYYLMSAYPVLYAAGAVALEGVLANSATILRIAVRSIVLTAMLVDAAAVAWTYLPIWHPGSPGWNWQMKNNYDMANEIGWPEFVAQVAAVRDTLSPEDRSRLAILANNYGEAGALSLYGPQYNLPTPISSTNGFHDRGYGPYEPETVIVVGGELHDQELNFEHCTVAAQVSIPYGVRNEESVDHPDILICHHLRRPWPTVWSHSQEFG
ncbi:MAG: glycosyltransferase family 39 protein [Terracidiphilus sp.]|jgi:4-amino-4-deoxy-L-arabinose transferase-like glycosyltransferase